MEHVFAIRLVFNTVHCLAWIYCLVSSTTGSVA